MATTNVIEFIFNNAIDDIAGPGQSPPSPQPAPNKADPIISRIIYIFIF